MTEYHLLPGTSEKLTFEVLNQLGLEFEINEHKDGYTISTSDKTSQLFGFYDGKYICSFYPTRSIGDWKSILKLIDTKVRLEMYDDDFDQEWMYASMHNEWSEADLNEKFADAVNKSRTSFGL